MKFLSHFAVCCLVAFALGSFSALSMAPYNLWPILFFSLSALYILIKEAKTASLAFLLGWLFGFGYFVFSLLWIGNAFLVEGNDYAWAWPLAVSALPAFLAIYTGLACFFSYKLCDLKTSSGLLGFCALYALSEWVRGYAFTGFPWNLFGYSWADNLPLLQTLSIGNIYYLTFLTLFWATLPAFIWLNKKNLKQHLMLPIIGLSLFIICMSFGIWRLSQDNLGTHENISIKLVQPNIAQDEKWDSDKIGNHFIETLKLSKPAPDQNNQITYIIWPETALNQWLLNEPLAIQDLQDTLNLYKNEAHLFSGALRHNGKSYFNSLIQINQTGDILNIYDKHHLVPFGEYIPLQDYIPLKPVSAFNGFEAGTGPQTLTTPEGLKYSPLICYEVLFPMAVIDRKNTPDFITNITNDAWYGDSAGPHQHFQIARFRAIEEGIPLLRVANTGFSALITPFGHIQGKTMLFKNQTTEFLLPRKNILLSKNELFENAIFLALITILALLAKTKKNVSYKH